MINFIKIIALNKNWQISQIVSFLLTIVLGYATLLFLKEEKELNFIFLSFVVFYFFNLLFYYFLRYKGINSQKNVSIFLLLIYFCSIFFYDTLGISLFVVVALISIAVLQDIIMVSYFSDINTMARKSNYKYQQIVVFSLVFTMFVGIIIKPLFGYVFDLSIKTGLYAILLVSLGGIFLYLNSPKTSFKKESIISNNKSVVVDKNIYLISLLSFIYNAIGFVGNLFVFPLIVLNFTKELNISSNVFLMVSVIAGVATVFSLFSNSLKYSSSHKIMLYNYFIGLLAWSLIFIIYLNIDTFSVDKSVLYVLILLLFMLIQFTAKLWSAGFLGSISELSNNNSDTYYHKKMLSIFMLFKSSGGVFGFSMCLLAEALWGNFIYGLFISAVLAILYGVFYINHFYENNTEVKV